MYRDLEIHKDKIKGHPIVQALTGDTTALDSTYEDVNDFNHNAHTLPYSSIESINGSTGYDLTDLHSSLSNVISSLSSIDFSLIMKGRISSG